MGKDHPRFREIDVYQCSPKCPNEEGQLKVVLFYRDENLRSHAVGHFANMEEIHEWKRWQDIDLNAVTKSIDSLREIGCPFFVINAHRPPCRAGEKRCSLFQRCSPVVSYLETAYQGGIEKILKEGGTIPRYARFQDRNNDCFCWMFPDGKVLAKLVWHEPYYNVMTCFRPKQGFSARWKEIRDYTIRKIQNEGGKTVTWCTEDNWGFGASDSEQDRTSHKREKHKSGRPKPKRHRRGAQSWREYISSE